MIYTTNISRPKFEISRPRPTSDFFNVLLIGRARGVVYTARAARRGSGAACSGTSLSPGTRRCAPPPFAPQLRAVSTLHEAQRRGALLPRFEAYPADHGSRGQHVPSAVGVGALAGAHAVSPVIAFAQPVHVHGAASGALDHAPGQDRAACGLDQHQVHHANGVLHCVPPAARRGEAGAQYFFRRRARHHPAAARPLRRARPRQRATPREHTTNISRPKFEISRPRLGLEYACRNAAADADRARV